MIISEIGLEPGVDRGDGGDIAPARPGDRAVGGDVGAGDMDDVGRERLEVAADPRGSAGGKRYSGRLGMAPTGMPTRSPVGGKAGLSTIGA